ncbi:MAG: hypothetical protein AAF802_09755 [Planctomycetota bacterium]
MPTRRFACLAVVLALPVATESVVAQQPMTPQFNAPTQPPQGGNQGVPERARSMFDEMLGNPFGNAPQQGQPALPQGGLPQGGFPQGGGMQPGFDQQDPTQVAPDMRRILEGEQEQARRDPPPPIEVVGKVIARGGKAKALLRVNSRYYLVEKGTRFSLPSNLEPLIFTVSSIDATGIDIQGGEENTLQRLQ